MESEEWKSVNAAEPLWQPAPDILPSYESDETREKLQMIRVKYLRLAHRLGQNTPHNVVVAQVLHRLGLSECLRGRNRFYIGASSLSQRASAMAEQLEAAAGHDEPLDLSYTIQVLGKTGVGKSATLNSIFDDDDDEVEKLFKTDAFHKGTTEIQDAVGTVRGIKVRVIDTPGLLPSWSGLGSGRERRLHNEKVLHSVKRFIKKTPPDVLLYVDRLDVLHSRDFRDMPLLCTITEILGPSIWFNAIVVMTHAGSPLPESPFCSVTDPSYYDSYARQRPHFVQQAIRHASGDGRVKNPVSLVENNHSACRIDSAGQRVLPNGQAWKSHLLLLCFAPKILAEAIALLKIRDVYPIRGVRPFAPIRVLRLPILLLSLLQSRPQLKLPEEQFGDEDGLGDDIDESTKDLPRDYGQNNVEEESSSGAAGSSFPVQMPDLMLPASVGSDNTTHQWLVRPVLATHGWDHDVDYEGVDVEGLFVLKDKVPLSFSGQVITKDKKDANNVLQMEISSSVRHGEKGKATLGFEMQSVGKDLAYTLRSEARFSNNFRRNKAMTGIAGLSITLLGDALVAGVKVEDKFVVNERFMLVVAGGLMARHNGDVAYGGSLEVLGRSLPTLRVSVMDWRGKLAVGCNVQSQIPVRNLVARANMNDQGAVSIRLNDSEQLQIALLVLIPLFKKLANWLFSPVACNCKPCKNRKSKH